jgi:signal transduction histidine kinase
MITALAHESRNALQQSQACLELVAVKVEHWPDIISLVQDAQKAQDRLHDLYEDFEARVAARMAEFARSHALLVEAARRKDEFLSMLAHELRNPLAAVTSAAELMHVSEDSPADRARLFAILERQLHQLVHVVDSLLKLGTP